MMHLRIDSTVPGQQCWDRGSTNIYRVSIKSEGNHASG